MSENGKHIEPNQKKKKGRKALAVICIILGVLVIGSGLGLFAVTRVLNDPSSLFKPAGSASNLYDTGLKPIFDLKGLENEDKAIAGTGAGKSDGLIVPKNKVVNILLMGLDAREDGSTTSGTEPHSDVVMVIAVNFEKNKVDLITLPRDLLTTTPGYRGFYKLNGTFNVGGGMSNLKGGYEQVCRTAEEWLGGISIPYYYAVDFQAVVQIVDTLGGIDYDVDQTFKDSKGKTYSAGKVQHLNGDAVLQYLRIRRAASGRDRDRTARQRRMLVAIFKKLKSEGSLLKIPELINSATSGIDTNTSLTQTASIVKYAADLEEDEIGTHVVDGGNVICYDWAFTYVYQQERIDLIKEIYGVEVGPIGICSKVYEKFLHEYGFKGLKYIRQAEKVLEFVNTEYGSESKLSAEQKQAYTDAYYAYDGLLASYGKASAWYEEHWENGGKYSGLSELSKDEETLKKTVTALAKAVGCKEKLSWSVSGSSWYNDTDINEVKVDFR